MNKIQELKNIFKQEYKKEITDKESFEINSKLINFFDLLQTIKVRNKLRSWQKQNNLTNKI